MYADSCLFCHACNAGAPGRTVLRTDGVLLDKYDIIKHLKKQGRIYAWRNVDGAMVDRTISRKRTGNATEARAVQTSAVGSVRPATAM